MHDVTQGHSSDRSACTVMWLVIVAAWLGALRHTHVVVWSLVSQDNWNHISPFLDNAAAGQLTLGNFLVQRAGVDHAQPLNKLVMWANAEWFGLDFRLEGYLGMAFGLAAIWVLFRVMVARPAGAPDVRRGWPFHLAFAAVGALFFSLNASYIYTFSMVTMWFSLYLAAFAMLLAAWHAIAQGRLWPLAVAAFVLGIVADKSAYLDGAALAIALGLYAGRAGPGVARKRAWQAIVVVALALLATRAVYAMFGTVSGTTQAIFNQPFSIRIAALAAQWRDAWQWFVVPATSGFAGLDSLQGMAGPGIGWVRAVGGVVLLMAHAWFWVMAMRLRPNAPWLAALMLMLMFYAHVAAVLMARVFARGLVFMEQPRYISFYQFGAMALLLMAMAWLSQRPDRRGRAVAALAVVVLALQVPVSWLAWQRESWIVPHNRQMAVALAELARDPTVVPANCPQPITLCTWPVERRVALIELLREQQLELFSAQYMQRHPGDAQAVEHILPPSR